MNSAPISTITMFALESCGVSVGYFANGFVFTSKPDFEAASKVVAGRLARGYKHNQHPVWLLDLWKPRGKLQLRCTPFCDPAADRFRADLDVLDARTRAFLTALERLQQAIGFRNVGAEVSNVHLALAMAASTRCPTFFFAADDEETDMGCNAVSGSLVSFGCRLDRLSVQYSTGQVAVTPLNYLEDGDEEGLENLIHAAKTMAGISVLRPRDIENGRVLYENPVSQWPKEAGNPAEILGLGTWDPLLHIESDFAVVFEKLSA
jgi:hypothetical protein